MNARNYFGIVATVVFVFLLAVSPAAAVVAGPETVTGTNAALDGNNKYLYIPLKDSTSGTLGVGGVGLSSDSVTLYGFHDDSEGYVDFVLDFDLTGKIGPGETIDPATANLSFTFEDIDFALDDYDYTTLIETLQLSFLADPSDTPSGTADLTIDSTNYGLFGPGFVPTDNVWRTYTLNLRDDLGVSDAQIAAMSADKDFGIALEFGAKVEHKHASYHYGDTVTNTAEKICNSFQFETVPEPATMVLLASGGICVMIRRRRK